MKKTAPEIADELRSRRSVEPHPCLTVPSEMHERMIAERDKKIAELMSGFGERDRAGELFIPPLKESPEPAREGWLEKWTWLIIPICMLTVFLFFGNSIFKSPAAPKGTVDATGYHDQAVNGDKTVAADTYIYMLDQRDHWLRNDREAWKALDCGHTQRWVTTFYDVAACKALDQ